MLIKATFYGGFPRSKKFISLYSKYLKNSISSQEFYRKTVDLTLKLLNKITNIGIKIGTDGVYVWDDILSPITHVSDALKANGLYRFFDNNFYVRTPVIKKKIIYQKCITCEWYKRIKSQLEKEGLEYILRAVLPGYALFALYSDDRYYSSKKEMLEDYHRFIIEEIANLNKIGIDNIELHDPALTYKEVPESIFDKVSSLYRALSNEVQSKIWLVTYFRYSYPKRLIYLFKNTCFIIHVDLVENKGIENDLLDLVDGKNISLGVLDARNTKIEKGNDIKIIVERFLKKAHSIYIAPNTFMEFIPEVVAYKKLRVLAKIQKIGG